MIYSMTGFGKAEVEGTNYKIVAEIKSVNHRFRDIRLKLGNIFFSQELKLQKVIEKEFKRGSFEVVVGYKKNGSAAQFQDLDFTKINDFISLLQKNVPSMTVSASPTDFLKSEFFKDQEDQKKDELYGLLEQVFLKACQELQKSREVEGEKLGLVIEGHLNEFDKNFTLIDSHADKYQESVKERLLKRLEEEKEKIKVDDSRFLQEVLYYLEKLDVHEEINRITAHMSELRERLEKGGEVGRRLDFLIQELNRETNTIGSKSNNSLISQAVVDMKVQLEKIREQALNIE